MGKIEKSNLLMTTAQWFRGVEQGMAPYLKKCGYELPDNIEYEFCFTQNGMREKGLGQTIFPDVGNGRFRIIKTWNSGGKDELRDCLGHQWGHVASGDPGHGQKFKLYWDRVGRDPEVKGLENAVPGWAMKDEFERVFAELPPFPGLPVDVEALRRKALKGKDGKEEPIGADVAAKQKTYQLKCECLAREGAEQCGYLARVTSKHLDEKGAPICPVPGHGPMYVHPCNDAAKPRAKAEAAPEPLLEPVKLIGYQPGGDA